MNPRDHGRRCGNRRFPAVACVLAFLLASPTVAQRTPELRFDFGLSAAPSAPGFTRVGPERRYTIHNGFGFVSREQRAHVQSPVRRFVGSPLADGISTRGDLVFQFDAPPGEYVVEVLLAGGTRTQWDGRITINDRVALDGFEPFAPDAEGESAPPYWGVFAHTTVDRGSVRVKIQADSQTTAVAALSAYPVRQGPIAHRDGRAVAQSLRAPNSDLALSLINDGRCTEALRFLSSLGDEWRTDKAALLLAAASRPECDDPVLFVETALAAMRGEYALTGERGLPLNIRLAELYVEGMRHYHMAGWQWSRDQRDLGIFDNISLAAMAFTQAGSLADHPLAPAARWMAAKCWYWLWVEQHAPHQLVAAERQFQSVKEEFGNHPLFARYMGTVERRSPTPIPPGVPPWAALQREAFERVRDLNHYWVRRRQGATGEFGGKFDDDVEMLRWWAILLLGKEDSTTLAGMRKLVEGVWNSGWIEGGYSKKVRDVEHASEPVADTQPAMVWLDYGNPVYVERCMESVRLMRDLWTSRSSRGHLHFRSAWFSSTQVDTSAPKDCDVGMNTRAVSAVRAVAWYNRHPEALSLLREWANAWLEDCLRTDKGKPRGIVPAAIRSADDSLGGHSNSWHRPGLFWDYYNWRGGGDVLLQLAAVSILLEDPRYVQPIELCLDLVARNHGESFENAPEGSEAWSAGILRRSSEFWDAVEVWRVASQESRFDSLIVADGSPSLRSRLSGSTAMTERSLAGMISDLDAHWELMTTEAYFTDRVEIRDIRRQRSDGLSTLESMVVGMPLMEAFYPFFPLAWKGIGYDVATLVERPIAGDIQVRIVNFADSAQRGAMVLLHSREGRYVVRRSLMNERNRLPEVVDLDTLLAVRPRTEVPFVLPPRSEVLLEVRQIQDDRRTTSALCDLAITEHELNRSLVDGRTIVTIPIHNIGLCRVDGVSVSLEVRSSGGDWNHVADRRIDRLEAPLDLRPRRAPVMFQMPEGPGRYRIVVKSEEQIPEITYENNEIEFTHH